MSVIPNINKKIMKMSDKEYFEVDALSNSGFRLLKESVLHFENQDLFKLNSPALTLGSAVHKLVLEPDSFNDDFIIEDFEGADLNKNTKLYKEAKAKWLDSVGNREVLSIDLFNQVTLMARNVKAIAGGLLKGGVAEHAFFSEFDNVPVKCKVDYLLENQGVVIDLKTTASIKDFQKSMIDYNYLTQGSFYLDVVSSVGVKVDRFVFILVETKKPYMVKVVEMGKLSIEEGRSLYGEYMQAWKDYKNNGVVNMVKTIEAPEWWLEKRRGI